MNEVFGFINNIQTKEFNNEFELQLLQFKRVLQNERTLIRAPELQEFLLRGITHNYQPLKELSFFVLKNQTSEEGSTQFITSLPFFDDIINAVRDKNPEISKLASDIIVSLGVEVFKNSKCNVGLKSISNSSEIDNMRVNVMILKIASKDHESLQYFVNSTSWYNELLQNMKTAIQSNDPLVTLNVLELFEDFFRSLFINFGELYSSQHHNLKIWNLLKDIAHSLSHFINLHLRSEIEIVFDNLIVPSILRILSFSLLIYYSPFNSIRDNFDLDLLNILKSTISHNDESIQEASIQAISSFAFHDGGLNHLRISNLLDEYLQFIDSSNELLFRSILHSISEAVQRRKEDGASGMKFCNIVFTNEVVQKIESNLMRPLPERRDSIYRLLDELAYISWGRSILLNFPSIIYFILDRSNEFTNSAMSWRYSILRGIAIDRDLCIHLNGDQFYLDICNYLSDGEFINEKKNPKAIIADEHI